MDFNQIVNRVLRVFRFDASVYREIAADRNALPGGLIVAGAAVVFSIIGQAWQQGFSIGNLVVGVFVQLLAFLIFALLTAFVSRVVFKGRTSTAEMARTLSYAYAWNLLGILRLIPIIGTLIAGLIWIPVFISGVFAVRESSEFDTGKAVLTLILVFIPIFLVVACRELALLVLTGIGSSL